MRKYYKMPKHIKSYITFELYNYNNYVKKIKEEKNNIINSSAYNDGQPRGNQTSNSTLDKVIKMENSNKIKIYEDKIKKMDRAFNNLKTDEIKIAEIIFKKGYSQLYAENYEYIGKETYYNIKNKLIYLTAIEYGEILEEENEKHYTK